MNDKVTNDLNKCLEATMDAAVPCNDARDFAFLNSELARVRTEFDKKEDDLRVEIRSKVTEALLAPADQREQYMRELEALWRLEDQAEAVEDQLDIKGSTYAATLTTSTKQAHTLINHASNVLDATIASVSQLFTKRAKSKQTAV